MNIKQEEKKKNQLGESSSSAAAKLKKILLFSMVKELNRSNCFHCSFPITKVEDFTVEHKIPWLDSKNPVELFFDLDNIAFSHFKCNSGAARKPHKKYFSVKEKRDAKLKSRIKSGRKNYTQEKRHERYIRNGK